MKDQTRLIIGTFIVLLGVGLLFDQTGLGGYLNVGWFFSNLWPLFLVVLGVSFYTQGNRTGGMIFTTLGAIFLLSTLLGWNFWAMIWPLFIIGAGLLVLFRGNLFGGNKVKESGRNVDASAVFWGSEKKISSENFEGGNINCLFGGVEYDLSKASIDKNGAEMNISVIFGGVELRVPENVEVISNITAILGGVEDKTETTGTPASKLVLTGTAMFGGVEIRN